MTPIEIVFPFRVKSPVLQNEGQPALVKENPDDKHWRPRKRPDKNKASTVDNIDTQYTHSRQVRWSSKSKQMAQLALLQSWTNICEPLLQPRNKLSSEETQQQHLQPQR